MSCTSRQSSERSEQQPTSSSSITAPQQRSFNDYEGRPSSSIDSAAHRHTSPRVSSGISSDTISLVALLEHTNRDNECVFYDYKAVSGKRRRMLTNKRLAFSFTRTSMCCRFVAGSRIPPPSCLLSEFPQLTGSTTVKSCCCRRRCSRSSCPTNATTSYFSQKLTPLV